MEGTAFRQARERGLGRLRPLPYFADKADALAWQGLDQALFVSAVADRLAHGVDAGRERGFRNNPAVPDLVDELVPAHDVIAVTDEVQQQVEGLRLHRNSGCAAA